MHGACCLCVSNFLMVGLFMLMQYFSWNLLIKVHSNLWRKGRIFSPWKILMVLAVCLFWILWSGVHADAIFSWDHFFIWIAKIFWWHKCKMICLFLSWIAINVFCGWYFCRLIFTSYFFDWKNWMSYISLRIWDMNLRISQLIALKSMSDFLILHFISMKWINIWTSNSNPILVCTSRIKNIAKHEIIWA